MTDFISEFMNPVEHIRADHAELTALRRDLHAHPELGFEEHRTAEIVVRELTALGIEHHSGIGKTGIVGVIGSNVLDGAHELTDEISHRFNSLLQAARCAGADRRHSTADRQPD